MQVFWFCQGQLTASLSLFTVVFYCVQIVFCYFFEIATEINKLLSMIIIICASDIDYETKFERFILLFDKAQFEKDTIARCKATNGFKFFFEKAAVTPTKCYIDLELLTVPLWRITHARSCYVMCSKLSNFLVRVALLNIFCRRPRQNCEPVIL